MKLASAAQMRELDRQAIEERGISSLEPVSYTHLDVYKRQAIYIAGAQVGLGSIHNGAAGRSGGGFRQIQKIAADIPFGPILACNVIPAVHQAVNGDNGAGVHSGKNGSVGRGAAADIDAIAIDTAIGLKYIVPVSYTHLDQGAILAALGENGQDAGFLRVVENEDIPFAGGIAAGVYG